MNPRLRNLVIVVVAFVAAVTFFLLMVSAISGRSGQAGEAEPEARPSAVDPDAPVVAFYGDSYTLGTGASDPSHRWSTAISLDRGWNEFNPSVNGLGFVNNRSSTPPDYAPDDEIPKIIEVQPDIVFVTMGLNDNFSMPGRADDIQDAITTDLRTLRDELPDARLIVVEPFWYTDARPDSVEQIIGWVREGAQAVGADYIAGASRWIEGHPEWMAADRQHPNDDGYAEMTRRMEKALEELGL
ncbi:SGNH/GDSL hydrolase family protein [Herbiconiux sp. CPCC 203407]|uniref:SGNH/GDSL hydrolase family protein n=1 Tax=Herbiconiux oxytropis TaxID=2970915 RepID=A0AA42BWQ1_9MICO|nr:SGNH/GDSL hydrolase family protein [Herbiconiux oxytropis]MCS5724224.1 SGNH/GDSL hydrolase family protein [Herbiconiux oxytropis]MCS5726833.1 SGNH/GDSL hydrolase family protein [Herbiconiux oxytropis]